LIKEGEGGFEKKLKIFKKNRIESYPAV